MPKATAKPARKRAGTAPAKVEKIDLYKIHKQDYVTPKDPVFVDIKPAKYLSIEGQGKPGGELFQNHIGALYSMAFTIKMTRKFAGKDYKVCGLEGLWWGIDPKRCIMEQPHEALCWKLLIRVPEFIGQRDLASALENLAAKKKWTPEAGSVRLETIAEGRCVQVLHVGPYSAEEGTIARMKTFAEEHGVSLRGNHHEIYVSDPRRVPPERLRTILRQPAG